MRFCYGAHITDIASNLVSGGLGALAGSAISWSQAAYYRRKSLKALRSALAAEIASIIWIGRSNKFDSLLRQRAESLRAPGAEAHNGGLTDDAFKIVADKNYFAVFEANADRLGELDPELAGKIVAFYQATKSWLDTVSLENAHDRTGLPLAFAADLDDLLATRVENLATLGDHVVRELSGGKMAAVIEEMVQQVLTKGTSSQ